MAAWLTVGLGDSSPISALAFCLPGTCAGSRHAVITVSEFLCAFALLCQEDCFPEVIYHLWLLFHVDPLVLRGKVLQRLQSPLYRLCSSASLCSLPHTSRRSSSVEGLPVNSSEVLVNSAQTPRSLRMIPVFIQLNLYGTTMVKEEEAINAGSRLSWEG